MPAYLLTSMAITAIVPYKRRIHFLEESSHSISLKASALSLPRHSSWLHLTPESSFSLDLCAWLSAGAFPEAVTAAPACQWAVGVIVFSLPPAQLTLNLLFNGATE